MSFHRLSALSLAALMAAAAPGFAQSPSCGGIVTGGDWMNGSEAASDISTAAGPFDLRASAARNEEIVTFFTLSAPSEVRVEAEPGEGSDTVIDLLDGNGSIVASDDDGGGGLASRAEMFLEPGSYCLLTRGLGGDPVTASIRVGRTEHEALTGGAFFAGESEVCLPETPALFLGGPIGADSGVVLSEMNSAEATPFYRFSTDGSAGFTITAENENADPLIYLYDGSGALIQENDDFDGLNARIDQDSPLPAGEYCVGVTALSNESEPITLTVSVFDEASFLTSLYDQGEAAPPLGGSYPVTDLGLLEGRMRQDVRISADAASWFTVEVPEGGVLLIDAIALAEEDPVLTVFDDLGRQIGYNDDNGDSLDSLAAVRVGPGLYMFSVTLLGEGGGSIRLALERFVRVR